MTFFQNKNQRKPISMGNPSRLLIFQGSGFEPWTNPIQMGHPLFILFKKFIHEYQSDLTVLSTALADTVCISNHTECSKSLPGSNPRITFQANPRKTSISSRRDQKINSFSSVSFSLPQIQPLSRISSTKYRGAET